MKLLSFDEYVSFYHKNGKCIDDISKPNKPLTDKRLVGKFEKYVKKENRKEERRFKKEEKVKNEWDDLKNEVLKRDGNYCQFLNMVKNEMGKNDYETLIQKAGSLSTQLDLAHIFPRSTYPELKYDPDNCVMVNRYCHSLLDEFKSPFTEERISLKERLNFFLLLIPQERLDRLKSKVNNKELFFS